MGFDIINVLIVSVLFVVMVLNLAARPAFLKNLSSIILVVALCGGLICYGYGYAHTYSNPVLASIKALLSVCGMFVGKNDLSEVRSAPLFQNDWFIVVFWIAHLSALYTTASAAITTVGDKFLKRLRLLLVRRGDLVIIYGGNEQSLAVGRIFSKVPKTGVVFVADNADNDFSQAVDQIGCVIKRDNHSLDPDQIFLKSIGLGYAKNKKKISVYAMAGDQQKNVMYATKLKKAFEEGGIASENLFLTIYGNDEELFAGLQGHEENGEEVYGYGIVSVFNEADVCARTLVQKYPPCDYIHFDKTGRAMQDFEVLIVGFGQVGQAVLKKLVMNGQFYGSHFKAVIFTPDYYKANANLKQECPQLFDRYDIQIVEADARSEAMYEYLNTSLNKLKYIVICTNNEKKNSEIETNINKHLARLHSTASVFICSHEGVYGRMKPNDAYSFAPLYSLETLKPQVADKRAILLNHYYCRSGKTPWKDWIACDVFSRASSRACADFFEATVKETGKTIEQVKKGDWGDFSDEMKLHLSMTEHLRWCAFHYCMGFTTMTEEEFKARKAKYLEEVETQGSSKIRLAKNLVDKTHACLIPWDDLDKLSEEEGNIIHKQIDYKQADTDNVMILATILQGEEE